MNWTLLLDEAVLRRIRVWGGAIPALPAELLRRLEEEVAPNPEPFLGEVVVPTTYRSLPIVFNGFPGVPEGLTCLFTVDADADARVLRVLSGRMWTPGHEF